MILSIYDRAEDYLGTRVEDHSDRANGGFEPCNDLNPQTDQAGRYAL